MKTKIVVTSGLVVAVIVAIFIYVSRTPSAQEIKREKDLREIAQSVDTAVFCDKLFREHLNSGRLKLSIEKNIIPFSDKATHEFFIREQIAKSIENNKRATNEQILNIQKAATRFEIEHNAYNDNKLIDTLNKLLAIGRQ